jgi:cytochrome b pre-mRNA-processing protein 3
MILPLFRRKRRPDTISSLYGMIVAQARCPVFYREYGVADTVSGRFDLLLLHLVLVVERLMRDEASKACAQDLFDRFCADMDDNLREIGIGDLSVPRHMKRVGEAFYGRAQAYQAALLDSDDGALAEALTRNIYGATPPPGAAARLSTYIRAMAAALDHQPVAGMMAGRLDFPDPATALAGGEQVLPSDCNHDG